MITLAQARKAAKAEAQTVRFSPNNPEVSVQVVGFRGECAMVEFEGQKIRMNRTWTENLLAKYGFQG